MCGYRGINGVEGYRSRRELHNQVTPGAADCFHHSGKLSTAVSEEHKKILRQQRCDPTTREVLRFLPDMLKVDPKDRCSAKTARDKFKHILHQADRASRNRGSQSSEAPGRQVTTPPRSGTIASDTSSPLLQHMNPRLSTTKGDTPQDTSAGASPKFDKILTQTPRNMTMTSETNSNGPGSLGIAPGHLSALMQQAIHDKLPNEEAESTTMHSPVLPDRTGQAGPMKESNAEQQPSALMSPFQDAGQKSPNHPQTPQSDASHRYRNTQPEPNSSPATATDPAILEDRPRPVQRQEAAIAPESSAPPTPPARLSFRSALQWRMDARTQRSAGKLPNNHLLRFLEGRDHVSTSV